MCHSSCCGCTKIQTAHGNGERVMGGAVQQYLGMECVVPILCIKQRKEKMAFPPTGISISGFLIAVTNVLFLLDISC